ncbi:MAG: hypothetical protein R2688_01495 [Fimbriimonadaceae bacterium]
MSSQNQISEAKRDEILNPKSNPYSYSPAMALTELARSKKLRVSAKISSEWGESFNFLAPFSPWNKEATTWRDLLKSSAARQLNWQYLPNDYGTSELVVSPQWEAVFPDDVAVQEARMMWSAYANGQIPTPAMFAQLPQQLLPQDFPFKTLTKMLFPASQYEMHQHHRNWTDPVTAWLEQSNKQFFDGRWKELPVHIQQVIALNLMSAGRQVVKNPDAFAPRELHMEGYAATDAHNLLYTPQYVWAKGFPEDTKIKLYLRSEDMPVATDWRKAIPARKFAGH